MTNKRTKRAQSIVELVAGVILIIPVVLLLIDLATLVLGVTSNDNLCREAARAASAGDPDSANARATAIVNQANLTKGGVIAKFELIDARPLRPDRSGPPIRPDGATGGGIVQGSVDVRTRVIVAPPFLLNALKRDDHFAFETFQSFPITFVVKQNVQPN